MGLFSYYFERRPLKKSSYVKAAHSLISTLDAVDNHPQLYFNKQVLQRAIHRYEHVWIPLLTRVPRAERAKLVPPLDVEWVWICHMLAPHIYAVDSAAVWKALVPSEEGCVIDHAVLDASQRQQGLLRAETLWVSNFPEEPFNMLEEIDTAPLVADTAAAAPEGAARSESRITYDIIAAAERQMAFHYQVAVTPHYRHNGFLETAAARYKMFLGLFKGHEGGRVVPTYDIDLMWHIHQLHPHKYARETTKIRGRLIPHDDTLNDRTEGAALSQCWEDTKKRWHAKYGGSICRPGGMFRGNVTGAERLLRARLEKNVVDIVGALPDDARHYTMRIHPLQETVVNPSPDGGVEWVHMTDVGNALKSGCKAIVRISELTVADTAVRMEVRQTNVAAREGIEIHSALEIFDGRNAQTSDALPLASVHVAPAGSTVL
ncbi:unnamed protein product, partial [Ascophyllum nodosum]